MYITPVEINKDHPDRTSKGYSELAIKQGSQLPSLAFGRDSRQMGVGKLYSGKKGKALVGGYWHEDSRGRLIELEHPA